MSTPEETVAAVEATRIELADILKQDGDRHALQLEQELNRRTKLTNRRFAFLFALLVLAFVLLAYRTEVITDALKDQQQATRQAFYDACLVRADRQAHANVGREALIQLAINGPNAPADSAAKDIMTQQLRDGLLLPVEDCGEPPVAG